MRHPVPEGQGKETEAAAQIEDPPAVPQLETGQGHLSDILPVGGMAADQFRRQHMILNAGKDLLDLLPLHFLLHKSPALVMLVLEFIYTLGFF